VIGGFVRGLSMHRRPNPYPNAPIKRHRSIAEAPCSSHPRGHDNWWPVVELASDCADRLR
jgi:hypothetical protein